MDTPQCYLCYDVETPQNPYAKEPCNCKGSIVLHQTCLQTIKTTTCTICNTPWRTSTNIIYAYYNNGQPIYRQTVLRSKKHGPYEAWYADGSRKIQCMYEDDQIHGSYMHWYKDATLAHKYNYVHGKKHGIQESWYPNGQYSSIELYTNGIIQDTQYACSPCITLCQKIENFAK